MPFVRRAKLKLRNRNRSERFVLLQTLLFCFGWFFTSFVSALGPQDSLKLMEVADGFEVSLVASEPEIRQPISVTFDERGRIWVIQYLQYPTPAGLKPISVDNYLRTKYDRVPEPPPRGPKGADRITICELDRDGKRAIKFKDFVNGLNLCSGLALGYGGVFVLQPPYLLFYPDKDRDDVPDADPEVLLTGFGMEDAHAVANSLTWGPDGWLYGAQGSTVTAHIRGLEFQQGIWRYHPLSKEFELFAEGGGNTWGLDFDERGEILAGTNFDDKMLHQVQGAYYVKNFGKHGALHNPYTYGYFGHVPYTGYRGRHISCGGIVYQGGSFPAAFHDAYIFANVLDHAVYWANLRPEGSSFTATFSGALLKTEDELFRPVDCETGPDGAVYIADWCDKRASHVDPLDTWDRSNGRIYRVQNRSLTSSEPKLANQSAAGFDLHNLSSDQLVDLLSASNAWFTRQAQRLLAERRDQHVLARLRNNISDNGSRRGNEADSRDSQRALQSLWALYVSGGFDEKLARELLTHPNENVRAWTVRFLGDSRKVSEATEQRLVAAARSDASPIVRAQLACSVKRLRGEDALPIIAALLGRDLDSKDQHIPLLIWWAIEDKAIGYRAQVIQMFAAPDFWRHAITRDFILERLARRYADEGGESEFGACAQLLQLAPDNIAVNALLQGLEQSLAGRKLENAPAALQQWFAKTWPEHTQDPAYLRLGLRLENANARQTVLTLLSDEAPRGKVGENLIEVLGETENPDDASLFLTILARSESEKVRDAALGALHHFPQAKVAEGLLEIYPRLSKRLQQRELNMLCSRPQWASLLVKSIEHGRIDPKEITLDRLKQMTALQNPDLNRSLEKRFGRIQANSPQEKLSSINRLRLVLNPSGIVGRSAKGNLDDGKKIFQSVCAVCHKLFGEGNSIGPDLTSADRKNTDYLLTQIVDPSAYIRPEYVAYQAQLKDESVIDGLMVESSPSAVTLLDRNNERHVLARAQIRELKESSVSLMPEGLLEALPAQGVMDIFAYLQADGPAPSHSANSQTPSR